MSTKFERGQKVSISPDGRSHYNRASAEDFPSGFGWVHSGPDRDGDYILLVEKDNLGRLHYMLGQYLTAVPELPRPITFDEVEVGDTVRSTEVYKSGESLVKTITVARRDYDNDLVSTSGTMWITAGTAARSNVTLELLARPEPKKVYKAGDVITRDEIKNLPNHTVITTGEADGETVRIFVNGQLYNEQAVNLGGFRPEEMHEDWTFTVRYVSEAGA